MTGALIQAGASVGYVDLDATYISQDLDVGPTATASIRFESDGRIRNHNLVSLGEWFIPPLATDGTGYEIRATPNPDTPDSGTMNTWLALTSTRTWTESRTGSVGADTKVFDIEIRSAGSGAVLASTTVTLKAQIIV